MRYRFAINLFVIFTIIGNGSPRSHTFHENKILTHLIIAAHTPITKLTQRCFIIIVLFLIVQIMITARAYYFSHLKPSFFCIIHCSTSKNNTARCFLSTPNGVI